MVYFILAHLYYICSNNIKTNKLKLLFNILFLLLLSNASDLYSQNKLETVVTDTLKSNSYSKKNALKFHIISPFFGNVAISYERSIANNSSIEFGAGIIYGRYNHQKAEFGGTTRFGYKYYKRNSSGFSIFKGWYLKPEFILSVYESSYNYTDKNGLAQTHNDNMFSMSLVLNYGYQYVYKNYLLVDFFAGLGGGVSSQNADYYYSNLSLVYGNDDIDLSITAGVKIGGLF